MQHLGPAISKLKGDGIVSGAPDALVLSAFQLPFESQSALAYKVCATLTWTARILSTL
jgi:hypothetical protein